MLADHGYSARCEGCRAALEGQPSQNHTESCRKRILDAIGGKHAPEVEAQRKRYDTFVDKAAAKEDSDELRDKKRMRSEEVQAPAPSDPNSTGASSSSGSSHVTPDQTNARGAKRTSEDGGRADFRQAQIEIAKKRPNRD